MNGPSDAEIMQRVQAGDSAQFELLVCRYRGPLLRVAESKLGSPVWAEDVVQETFLSAFVSRHTYRPQYAFRTWLWTILLNACRKEWKRSVRRPASEPLEVAGEAVSRTAAAESSGLGLLLAVERRAELQKWLGRLSEAQADALRLRFFGELPYEEIAATMGSSVSAAKQRVRFGLEKLATLLGSRSGESV